MNMTNLKVEMGQP